MKLTLKEKVLYCMGSLGMGVVTVTHMLFLVWYFLPPETANLPSFIDQDWRFLGLTIMGLILALRTIFDAVSDSIVANYSDKILIEKKPRTTLLKWSALPFAASYFFVFLVPVKEVSSANVIWITTWLVLCTFFLTVYSINHEALLAKIAKNKNERVDLGTFASASWFIGFVIISAVTALWGLIQDSFGVDKVTAILYTFAFASILGGILMILPGLFINEDKFEEERIEQPDMNVVKALSKIMGYKNYRKFIFANTLYTSATYIFETGLIYFVTVLAVLSEETLGLLTLVIGAVTLLMYPLINHLAKKKGRKFVLLTSFVFYVVTFLVIAITNQNPTPWLYLGIILIVAPFSQAGFGILPVIIASDNADYMREEDGEDRTAMFMGVSGFTRKLGATFSALLFTSLIVLGKDVGDDMGIRLVVLIAAILSILGFFIMKGYNEQEVLKHHDYQESDI